jgi:hypothetical protein
VTIRAYWIEDAALAQLEVALRLYFDGVEQDLLSVITLAGAAEEILGQLLVAEGKENSIEQIKKAVVAISERLSLDGNAMSLTQAANRANRAKNKLKHWDGRTDEPMLKLDPAEEARDMLSRAIDNYWMLKLDLTPAMARFQREVLLAGRESQA